MQKHGERYIWINPPAIPLSTEEMDSVFALPYSAFRILLTAMPAFRPMR